MAAMLSAMQSTAVHQNAKQNSRASVQNKAKPKPKQSRAGEEDIPIVSRIRSLRQLIDQGHKVTHGQVVHKLREVLASEGGGSSQEATADEPTDAEERISVEKERAMGASKDRLRACHQDSA